MIRKTVLATFAAAMALCGCGGKPASSNATGPSVGAAANVQQEAVSRIGEVTIRASAVQTSSLAPPVAAQYGIARDDRTVLLVVAVRQGPEAHEVALPAQITASATDLRGRRQAITMRELRAGGTGSEPVLLDYIGTVDVSPPDTLRFDVTVAREGGATSTMQFSRDFYPH